MKNKYSLKDILEKEVIIDSDNTREVRFNEIEIPMIQRDYAQGRAENSDTILNETGKRFLDSIFKALKNGDELEMDFIYGSILNMNQNGESTFIPLDGQQRLTTLFLLYWYIGSRELDETKYTVLMNLLKKFTYSTRPSSRRFCELLCKLKFNEIPFENKILSKEISNLSLFFYSYRKDPTIKAMFNMLDAIHEKYQKNEKTSLYDNLEKLQFYILPLDDFDLTEDLYIKMNARGKPLTNFENFKADLINCMKSNENSDKEDFQKQIKYNDRNMLYYMSISQKMDNQWTDMFWKLSKNENDKLVDPFFMRFFYRYFLNRYILVSTQATQVIGKEDFNFLTSESSFQNFDVFKTYLSYNEIKTFEKNFDTLAENWDEIDMSISPLWYRNEKYSFWENSITQSGRVVFCAIMLYFEKNDTFDVTCFKQWMRIVWNIVENTDISDWSSAIGVMKLIAELSDNSAKIYKYLANTQLVIKSDSSKIAIAEEKRKCSFIYSDGHFCKEWETAFIEAESHPFFKGAVNFLISDKMQIDEFKHRTELAKKTFDEKGVNEKYRKKGHIFLRALISRYTELTQIEGKYFTDTDESEHYFKKMLASDEVIQKATSEWFSLNDENDLMYKLNEEVHKESQIISWEPDNLDTQRWLKKVHEELYKNPDLQDWIHEKKTIYAKALQLNWYNDQLYISRPRAWYDWMLLGSYRNEIISKLLLKPYNCSTRNQCRINGTKIPYYWGKGDIRIAREIEINDNSVVFEYCFNESVVIVGIRETDELNQKYSNILFTEPTEDDNDEKETGWICRKIFDYYTDVTQEKDIDAFIENIESEVFTGQNSLVVRLEAK